MCKVNPVLEAFGNAKTLRNNNSSRFGKFTEMRFDGAAKLVGASVETYLLEKPRVVAPAEGERTFHVFYQLVAGASAADRGRWHLDNNATASDFDVLARGHCTSIGGVDDAADFTEMRTALGTVGFAPEECASVFDVIAALLHLGNVSFEGTAARSATPSSRLSDVGRNAAAHVSVLLGIRESLLCERLTLRIINAGGPKARTQGSRSGAGDTMKIPLSPLDAEFARDALAKYIYARLVFPWLVHRINSCLPRDDAVSAALIGILDIAGFEVFERNGFEQLCINHANEQIQQYFNRQILLQEQDIYELEGLRYRRVEFHDNTTTIDLLEERSQGILALLDEECVMPKATDKTFTNKVCLRFSYFAFLIFFSFFLFLHAHTLSLSLCLFLPFLTLFVSPSSHLVCFSHLSLCLFLPSLPLFLPFLTLFVSLSLLSLFSLLSSSLSWLLSLVVRCTQYIEAHRVSADQIARAP